MLQRALSFLIVVFWLTMTTLLIRTELQPERAALRSVPIEHVRKLFYHHEQPSDLVVVSDGTRIGNLRIHPKVRIEDKARILEFTGSLNLKLSATDRQHITWDGQLEMDPEYTVRSAFVGIGVRHPTHYRTELLFTAASKQVRYELKSKGTVVEEETMTLDEAGLRKIMDRFSFDPSLLENIRTSSMSQSEVTAQQSSIYLHNERLDTYLVSFKQGGQTLFEFHVSQLGQVLKAKTVFGWTMAPEDVIP